MLKQLNEQRDALYQEINKIREQISQLTRQIDDERYKLETDLEEFYPELDIRIHRDSKIYVEPDELKYTGPGFEIPLDGNPYDAMETWLEENKESFEQCSRVAEHNMPDWVVARCAAFVKNYNIVRDVCKKRSS